MYRRDWDWYQLWGRRGHICKQIANCCRQFASKTEWKEYYTYTNKLLGLNPFVLKEIESRIARSLAFEVLSCLWSSSSYLSTLEFCILRVECRLCAFYWAVFLTWNLDSLCEFSLIAQYLQATGFPQQHRKCLLAKMSRHENCVKDPLKGNS